MPNFLPVTGSTVVINAGATSTLLRYTGTTGQHLKVTNSGPNKAYIAFGTSSLTATVADCPVLPNTFEVYDFWQGMSYVAAVCQSAGETAVIELTRGFGGAI